MSWFKKKKEVAVVEVKKEKSLAEILDNPWYINRVSYSGEDKEEIWYEIKVYRFDESSWESLCWCSREIVGVQRRELYDMCKDIFGSRNIYGYLVHDMPQRLYFRNKEDAEKIIEEFRPYYDTYHIPRTVADRLTNYDEENGGYPAPMYLKERAGAQGDAYQIKLVK